MRIKNKDNVLILEHEKYYTKCYFVTNKYVENNTIKFRVDKIEQPHEFNYINISDLLSDMNDKDKTISFINELLTSMNQFTLTEQEIKYIKETHEYCR